MLRPIARIGLGVWITVSVSCGMWMPAVRAQFPKEPPKPPLGLPPVQWPEQNPYSAEKAQLGKLLFFDNRLSTNKTVSCASCHAPAGAFTDNLPVSVGIGNQRGGRSAPTVINRAYTILQFWDGRARSLEEQAKGPIANPIEMTTFQAADEAHAAVVERVRSIPGYVELFKKAFGDREITLDEIVKAIATFERTIYSGNAPYDRHKAGETSALTPAQLRGRKIFFGKGRCDSCHLGFNFSDESFMNIGIGMDKPEPDLGRYEISKREEDKGAFKTPTLREIEHTAPYMHDGSMQSLEEVVEHYNKGGIKNPWLSQQIKPLGLTEEEKADLVAFLKALSGEGWRDIQPPAPGDFPQ